MGESPNSDNTLAAVAGEPRTRKGAKSRRVDWTDPAIPVGDAPPLPRWPLVLASLAWLGWVAFLVAMLP